MPNGHDKNWLRHCAAIEGFKAHHGRWPTRVRLYPLAIEDLRDHLFTPEDFARITAKISPIADEAPMIAEDDTGASYSYGEEGFPKKASRPRAAEWLDVRPQQDEFDSA